VTRSLRLPLRGGALARPLLGVLALGLVLAFAFTGGLAPRAASADEPDAVHGDTFCVRVGRLYTGRPGEVLSPALIVVSRGKIVAVVPPDQAVTPPELPIIDRSELVAMPGLVACALWTGSGRRGDETAGARYRAIDGFDPYEQRLDLLSAGVTTGYLNPGRGRLISGEGAVVKLGGAPGGRVLRERAELVADLGETALGPPLRVTIPVPSSSDVPIVPGERQRPTSRVGLVAELEARLRAALDYDARRGLPAAERPKLDPDLEALAEALGAGSVAGSGQLRIDVRRASEVLGAIDLAWDLGLRPVLSGLTEAGDPQVTAALAALDAPCVYELPMWTRSEPWDRGEHPNRLQVRHDTPRRLADAGVTFALSAPPGSETELRLLAAMSVRGGLAPERALAAITREAAKVLGVADRVGTLAAGRDADFVLLSGEPLGTRAEVMETWIDGRAVWRAPASSAVVVRAGTVLTLSGEALRDGEVLIEDGRIAAVGSSVPHPRGARVIDAGPDGVVTPGLIDAYGHLGLSGDRTAAGSDVLLHGLIAREREPWREVARAGVTTVLMAPWNTHGAGSRVVAIKTAEGAPRVDDDDLRRGLVLREVAGVVFDLSSMDPLSVPSGFASRLQAGKVYAAKWEKHRAELAKWLADDAKRRLEGRPAGEGAAEKKGGPAPGPDEPAPAPKVDPISGVWAATISGGPMPQPQSMELVLRLDPDGSAIQGVARTAQAPGQDAAISGTLVGTKVTLTVELDTPMGHPRVEAELDAEDHLTGKVRAGPIELEFDANRTQREAPEIKVLVRRRGARGGRPTPPPVDPSLEPLRLAFERRATLLLHVAQPIAARTLLDHVESLGLRAVFVGLTEGHTIADRLLKSDTAIVLRPDLLVRPAPGRLEEPPATLLSRAGLRIAFMSNAEDGAAELPLRAVLAVHRGLSWTTALRALTIDAARAHGIDDRVGSLEVGKDGDLVVWTGPPLEATSRVAAVVVNGRVVD
jgi:imidazolonepropionase-like amidohydrolase